MMTTGMTQVSRRPCLGPSCRAGLRGRAATTAAWRRSQPPGRGAQALPRWTGVGAGDGDILGKNHGTIGGKVGEIMGNIEYIMGNMMGHDIGKILENHWENR